MIWVYRGSSGGLQYVLNLDQADAGGAHELGVAECGWEFTYLPDPYRFRLYLPGLLTLLGSAAGGTAEFTGDGDKYFSLFRQEGNGPTSCRMIPERIVELHLPDGELVPIGIAPFQGHEDVRIRNMGDGSVRLTLRAALPDRADRAGDRPG